MGVDVALHATMDLKDDLSSGRRFMGLNSLSMSLSNLGSKLDC